MSGPSISSSLTSCRAIRSVSACSALATAPTGGVWFEPGVHLGVERDFAPARKAHPGLRVEDLDAIAARLADAGADVEWDERWPGVRRFYTRDPFGNRLELLAGP